MRHVVPQIPEELDLLVVCSNKLHHLHCRITLGSAHVQLHCVAGFITSEKLRNIMRIDLLVVDFDDFITDEESLRQRCWRAWHEASHHRARKLDAD